MKKNYDFSKGIKNPYAKRLKGEIESSSNKDNVDKSLGLSPASKKRKAVKTPQRPSRARAYDR